MDECIHAINVTQKLQIWTSNWPSQICPKKFQEKHFLIGICRIIQNFRFSVLLFSFLFFLKQQVYAQSWFWVITLHKLAFVVILKQSLAATYKYEIFLKIHIGNMRDHHPKFWIFFKEYYAPWIWEAVNKISVLYLQKCGVFRSPNLLVEIGHNISGISTTVIICYPLLRLYIHSAMLPDIYTRKLKDLAQVI